MTIPTGADISEFLHSAEGIGWLLLVVALGYGGYRVQRTLRWNSRPSRPGDRLSRPAAFVRLAILSLYSLGAILVVAAIPLWLLLAQGESAGIFYRIGLAFLSLGVGTIAASLLLLGRDRDR